MDDTVTAPEDTRRQEPVAGKKGGAADEFIEIVKTIVYALLIALVLRVLLFQPFTIPSGSMIPNLLIGDYIIVSKYSYGYSRYSIPFSPHLFDGRLLERRPERGDIVVFKFPPANKVDYIKRVMGLPGDRIQVRDGIVYLNDQPLPQKELAPDAADSREAVRLLLESLPGGEQYVTQDQQSDGFTDNTEVFVVPEGHYFMMGDNRDNSSDSRVPQSSGGVGYVPAENLVGKAQIILFSWDEGASLFKPWTWFTKARVDRFLHRLK
jgi:signal peptidase I